MTGLAEVLKQGIRRVFLVKQPFRCPVWRTCDQPLLAEPGNQSAGSLTAIELRLHLSPEYQLTPPRV